MKQLNTYIKESIEDNLLWMIDNWFYYNDTDRQEFIDIIANCQKSNSLNNIEDYISKAPHFKDSYKQFVNYMNDDIDINSDKDYIYQFKEIVKLLIGNKSSKNKYINK